MMTLKPTKSEQIETLTREQIAYEIGRAQGTASRGLTMSGDYRRGDAK